MAKQQRRRKIKRVTTTQLEARLDATPERLAKGDHSEFVNPAEIDPNEQRITSVRRFRMSHLDRLHRAEKLNLVQWYAGDWYRNTHHRCAFGAKVTGSYGERTTGGMQEAGLPRTEAQWRARQDLRQAREQWPQAVREHMDRFLLEDTYPRLSHRARDRDLGQMRNALDRLAMYLRLL
ncbi:hypothetical protein IP68_12360 [Blastomonas sp. AAP25]|uniref:hypothetical protein n=1 Tax=Blastomonas sp. AAP25 TaxID=1523416 RepID=UPI0006B8E709|nr:hypothetical protein [Blastomonas sp. AAP25]KPF74554.1 hypothetical protein IP68_12360 [Blastomonas sp. AAP25]